MEQKVGLFSGDSSQHAFTMTTIISFPFSSDREGRSGSEAVGSLIRRMISEIHLEFSSMPELWAIEDTSLYTEVFSNLQIQFLSKSNRLKFQRNLNILQEILEFSWKMRTPDVY